MNQPSENLINKISIPKKSLSIDRITDIAQIEAFIQSEFPQDTCSLNPAMLTFLQKKRSVMDSPGQQQSFVFWMKTLIEIWNSITLTPTIEGSKIHISLNSTTHINIFIKDFFLDDFKLRVDPNHLEKCPFLPVFIGSSIIASHPIHRASGDYISNISDIIKRDHFLKPLFTSLIYTLHPTLHQDDPTFLKNLYLFLALETARSQSYEDTNTPLYISILHSLDLLTTDHLKELIETMSSGDQLRSDAMQKLNDTLRSFDQFLNNPWYKGQKLEKLEEDTFKATLFKALLRIAPHANDCCLRCIHAYFLTSLSSEWFPTHAIDAVEAIVNDLSIETFKTYLIRMTNPEDIVCQYLSERGHELLGVLPPHLLDYHDPHYYEYWNIRLVHQLFHCFDHQADPNLAWNTFLDFVIFQLLGQGQGQGGHHPVVLQTVHNAAVHASTSESMTNLQKRYSSLTSSPTTIQAYFNDPWTTSINKKVKEAFFKSHKEKQPPTPRNIRVIDVHNPPNPEEILDDISAWLVEKRIEELTEILQSFENLGDNWKRLPKIFNTLLVEHDQAIKHSSRPEKTAWGQFVHNYFQKNKSRTEVLQALVRKQNFKDIEAEENPDMTPCMMQLYQSSHIAALQRAWKRIMQGPSIIDPVSKITLKKLLIYLWIAAHDPHHWIIKEPYENQSDIINHIRENTEPAFLMMLVHIQREYNADDDYVSKDSPACAAGTFGHCINAFQGLCEDCSIIYLSADKAFLKIHRLISFKLKKIYKAYHKISASIDDSMQFLQNSYIEIETRDIPSLSEKKGFHVVLSSCDKEQKLNNPLSDQETDDLRDAIYDVILDIRSEYAPLYLSGQLSDKMIYASIPSIGCDISDQLQAALLWHYHALSHEAIITEELFNAAKFQLQHKLMEAKATDDPLYYHNMFIWIRKERGGKTPYTYKEEMIKKALDHHLIFEQERANLNEFLKQHPTSPSTHRMSCR